VVEQQIMQDHTSGRSRGFGFVTFDNEQIVDEILNSTKVHELGGKQVKL
jgi:RNA recognition motif-containing protein